MTQSGGGPCAFVASQPSGNAGGTTPSKFSLKSQLLQAEWTRQRSRRGSGKDQGIEARQRLQPRRMLVGVPREPGPAWLLARENAIAANKTAPAETRQAHRKTFRHADDVDAPFGSPVMTSFYQKTRRRVNTIRRAHASRMLAMASLPTRTSLYLLDQGSYEAPKFVSAWTPKPTRETRALPGIATPAPLGAWRRCRTWSRC